MAKRVLAGLVLLAVTGALIKQVLMRPVIGLADQGDFRRTIGRFGYGPALQTDRFYAYVSPKYLPDTNFRLPEWEQISSEYLFIKTALFINRFVSKDRTMDIRVMGLVHAVVFLSVFARFLFVTRRLRAWA